HVTCHLNVPLSQAWGPALARSFTSTGRRHSFSGGGSPAVVREGLVGLGHLARVLAALHAGPEAVARVEQLVLQALDHRLLTALTRVRDHPAERKGRRATGLDLDGHLVCGTTDTTALH